MIYLASPYSHPDRLIRLRRYNQALTYTTLAMKAGETIFSPIVYGHNIYEAGFDDYTAAGWKHLNDVQVNACSEVRVLQIDGWDESSGVNAEMRQALFLNKPVTFARMPKRVDREYIA